MLKIFFRINRDLEVYQIAFKTAMNGYYRERNTVDTKDEVMGPLSPHHLITLLFIMIGVSL